jgi:hypothetical protein
VQDVPCSHKAIVTTMHVDIVFVIPFVCRLLHVSCKVLLKHLPAASQGSQQQWPLALALAAGEAVNYAKQHLGRCVPGC